MKDYARIASKIRESQWLITPEGLFLICDIVQARINGEQLTDSELAVLLESAGTKGSGNKAENGSLKVENGVGVLPLYGPIFGKANMMTRLSGATSLETFRKDLRAMLSDPTVNSILLDIDSPGGTSEMVPEAGQEILAGRDIKPIHAIANGMAGSAAYWLASQASKLYSNPSGSVGSVGAYTVHEDQSAADAKQGVKYTFISAGPYKTEGNSHESLSSEGAAYRQELINELYDEFLTTVASGRNTSVEEVKSNYGGGRMVPAKRALDAGMIDGIMEFDTLVESLMAPSVSGTGNRVQVSFNGRSMMADFDPTCGVYKLETAEWEHSEPGTGSPPTPAYQDHVEPDITTGSRRPDLTRGLPNEADEPGAPKASANNGGKMELNELYQLFGVDNEEALLAAIREMHAESSELRANVSMASQELDFAKQYPDVYKQMMTDRSKTLMRDADDFISSIQRFTKLEGDKKVQSTVGLSALASDMVKESYLKFAQGEGGLDDFINCVTAITDNGTLDYGEHGSAREEELPEFSINSASGIASARNLFATKVAEIQRDDKLDYKAAIAEASRRHPDLAAAYSATASA